MVFHFAKARTLSFTVIPPFHTQGSHGWENQPPPLLPYLYSNLVVQAAVGCQHLGSPASTGHSHHHHPEQHEGVHLSEKSHGTQ